MLHQMTFRDKGRERSVINRASLVEMVVPYGDPSPVQHKKNAFDAGEYNIGALANSLALGCDCSVRSTTSTLWSAIVMETRSPSRTPSACTKKTIPSCGSTTTTGRTPPRSVAHASWSSRSSPPSPTTNTASTGTSTSMAPSSSWSKRPAFCPPRGQVAGTKSLYGQTLNNDGLYAPPIHQHIFNVRLDFELDGPRNAVYEVDTVVPEDNPTQSCFYTVDRLLPREQDAVRRADAGKHRFWKIVNHDSRNLVDEPVAYRLQPTDAITLCATPESWVSKRAGFATNNFWVTAYDESERYPRRGTRTSLVEVPACPNTLRPTATSSTRTSSCGTRSACIMWCGWRTGRSCPRQHVGFILQPHGFFDQNPTLNLPVPERNSGVDHCGCEG